MPQPVIPQPLFIPGGYRQRPAAEQILIALLTQAPNMAMNVMRFMDEKQDRGRLEEKEAAQEQAALTSLQALIAESINEPGAAGDLARTYAELTGASITGPDLAVGAVIPGPMGDVRTYNQQPIASPETGLRKEVGPPTTSGLEAAAILPQLRGDITSAFSREASRTAQAGAKERLELAQKAEEREAERFTWDQETQQYELEVLRPRQERLAKLQEDALNAEISGRASAEARAMRQERRQYAQDMMDFSIRNYEARDNIARNIASAYTVSPEEFFEMYNKLKTVFTPFTPEQLAQQYSQAMQSGGSLADLTGPLDVNQTRVTAMALNIPEERIRSVELALDKNDNSIAKTWGALKRDVLSMVEEGTLTPEEAREVLTQDVSLLTAEASRPSRGIQKVPEFVMPESLLEEGDSAGFLERIFKNMLESSENPLGLFNVEGGLLGGPHNLDLGNILKGLQGPFPQHPRAVRR